jgi:CubicO group peptidase (beta-lactamase class C family)
MLQSTSGVVALMLMSARGVAAEEPARKAAIDEIADRLPRTLKVIAAAAEQGNRGQLYVSRERRVIADVAWGKTASGADATPQTLVSWASAVKPTTCTCLMQLWERGKLDLDDRVTRYIPEFGVNDKQNVRIRHLLTHTAHLGGYEGPINLSPKFADTVNKIIAAPRTPYRGQATKELPPLGSGPGYNPAGIWIIAEICRRLDGRAFNEIIRKDIYEPCGMLDSWCGMPAERQEEYQKNGRLSILGRPEAALLCQPAGGGVGPTRELARFYEMMLGRGTINGNRIISPQTVEAMSTPKTGPCYMGMWGLGFNVAYPEGIAESREARRTERYGPHSSPRTFGHAGASGMQASADPEYALAIAHIGRLPLHGPIYEDLGLARTPVRSAEKT